MNLFMVFKESKEFKTFLVPPYPHLLPLFSNFPTSFTASTASLTS